MLPLSARIFPLALGLLGLVGACSSSEADGPTAGGGVAGALSPAGAGGGVAGAATGGAGAAQATGTATGGTAAGTAMGGGGAAGNGGSSAGAPAGGTGGALGGASGAGAGGMPNVGGMPNAGGTVNNIPGDYKGTPFTELAIPGRINAADYDRGGAGVAWCHDMGNCAAGTVTGDYPQGSGVYRPPMPATAKLCSGAACDDNVGVCRMNPSKPDNTVNGQAMPPQDTYLCYSVAGQWTKYTVTVQQAGTYAVGGIVAVPQNGAFNLAFGGNITTGNVPLAITSTANSGSGENYHSWDDRKNLATVTFPAPGRYVMTFTQVGRFNADAFTFTKM